MLKILERNEKILHKKYRNLVQEIGKILKKNGENPR